MEEAKEGSGHLLTPYNMGNFKLGHRNRSYNNTPQPHAIEYYSQRTTNGGLVISEAAAASDISQRCTNMPGIWTKEQVEAWKPIVDAVHEKGGVFFCQIWHPGRIFNSSAQTFFFIDVTLDRESKDQEYEYPTPSQLDIEEIPQIINDFRVAARNAMDAGFDGVEILGANGYLIDKFLKDQENDRTDKYGGSLENRCRLALEVVEAASKEIGAERVGIKLRSYYHSETTGHSDPEALGIYLSSELSKLGILFLHVSEPRMVKKNDDLYVTPRRLRSIRKAFKGTFIASGGYNKCGGDKAVAENYADLISFGRLFLANPDLPKRFELNASLNKHDRKTFYTGDPVVGYTDYPFLEVASEFAFPFSNFKFPIRQLCSMPCCYGVFRL